MKPNTIDPTSFTSEHPLAIAMRSVSRHWFLAYSKLMSMEWEWSTAIPYGATDGRRLLLNKAGIAKLCRQPNPSGLIAFLLVHEALHALLGHGWRLAKMTDARRANVAADYIINAMIKMRNEELNKEVFPFIEGVLLDEALSGDKSVEQLYRELTKPQQQPETNPKPSPTTNEKQDKENSEGQPEEDSTPAGGDQDSLDGGDSGDDGGDVDGKLGDDDSGRAGTESGDRDEEGGGDVGSGSGDAEGDGPPDGDSSPSVEESGDLSDFVGTGADDNMEPELEDGETQADAIDKIEEDNDRILIADEIDRRQQSASGATGQRIGSLRTSGSTLGWPDLLREWLTSRSRCGWDAPFNAPVYSTTGVVSAGRRKRKAGDIVLVLDTSGSIGQRTYDRFLQEAQAVLDELKPDRLHLLSVSHIVADAVTLESGDMVPAKLNGGGGTAFKPAFDWVSEHIVDLDVMVYLTDGWSNDLTSLPQVDFPLLWLTTQRPVSEFKMGDAIAITEL